MVMIANQSGREARALAERYRGSVGHLYSPSGQRGPFECFPYALDNGAFVAFRRGAPWDSGAWLRLLDWASQQERRPLWALVPDSVGDRRLTLELWRAHSHEVASRGLVPAFAAQDGMTPEDVPSGAAVVFVGGSLPWKWSAIRSFSSAGRMHVGRVNTLRGLDACAECGAESVDGTGWFRGDRRQLSRLVTFLEEQKRGARSGLF